MIKKLIFNYLITTFMEVLILTLCNGLAGFLKFYTTLLTLRVYITWFPNLNMYHQPLLSLGKITDPYLRLFRGMLPPLIGVDLSPLLAFVFLTTLVDLFSSVAGTI
jgi:YggT family protein